MKRDKPEMQNVLSMALHRQVDQLELSNKARNNILAEAQPKLSTKVRIWPDLVWAAAACLLVGILASKRLMMPSKGPDHSQFKCVAVVYTDDSHSDWSSRVIIMRKTNGKESYIKVVAKNPRRKESIT